MRLSPFSAIALGRKVATPQEWLAIPQNVLALDVGVVKDKASPGPPLTPVTVTGMTTATSVTVGPGHSCARLADGTVSCWGDNGSGQLGNRTTTSSSIPVTVEGL